MSIGIEELSKIFVPMAKRFHEKEAKHGDEWKKVSVDFMKQRVCFMYDLFMNAVTPKEHKKALVDLANQAMLLYLRLE